MLVFICDFFKPFLLPGSDPATAVSLSGPVKVPASGTNSEPKEKYKVPDKQLAELIEVSRSLQNQNTVHGWIVYFINPI